MSGRFVAFIVVAIAVAGGGTAYGIHAEHQRRFPATLFFDDPVEQPKPDAQATPADAADPDAKRNDSIFSLQYVRGRTKAGEKRKWNVTVARPEMQDGYNLVVSADRTEIRLMTLQGGVVHIWWRAFPDIKRWIGESSHDPFPPPDHLGRSNFRRAYVFPDGSLLAIFEELGLVKLAVNSKVQWAYRGGAVHHALDVAPDGTIYTLSKRRFKGEIGARTFASLDQTLIDDELVVLAPDGTERKRFSILEAIQKSGRHGLLEGVKHTDLLHTNSVHYVRHGAHAGSILVCFRHLNTIAMIDPVRETVGWTLSGMFHAAHEPTVLENGNILLFDNRGNRGASRVIEIEPATQSVVWRYPPAGEDAFFSATCGTCQRLRNGNTLITESENGRAFEVTPAGDIVWDWYSPYRFQNELIATTYDVHRVYPDEVRFKLNKKP